MAEVTYDLKVPAGAPFTADALPAFVDEAKALSLAPDVAQKLVDHRAKSWPRVPDKYELKVPGGATFAPADLEAIGAEARALGLTNAAAQTLVELRAKAAPVVPDKYELAAPQGSPLTDVDLASIAAEAKALGLPQAKAQALVESRATAATATRDTFLTELKADSELGGTKFDASVALAKKGLDYLFPPGAAETAVVIGLLERTGLGNHKALVRAFARLGAEVAEDAGAGGSGGSGGGQALTLAERLYGKAKAS